MKTRSKTCARGVENFSLDMVFLPPSYSLRLFLLLKPRSSERGAL